MPASLGRRALAELIGTGLLVTAVIGSGIAASRLSPGDAGLQLLENAAATGAALVAIILAFGPVSGAHLNPAITLLECVFGSITPRQALAYGAAQVAAGMGGALAANAMFEVPVIELSTHARDGDGVWLGEALATLGLALVVFGVVRSGRGGLVAFAVGSYIGGAYFFTSSTSFANPAVTVARTLSDTFAGIRPVSAILFVLFQLVGTMAAAGAIRVLWPELKEVASDVG
jgi:glycerol uptake facilitator-like aquaporin